MDPIPDSVFGGEREVRPPRFPDCQPYDPSDSVVGVLDNRTGFWLVHKRYTCLQCGYDHFAAYPVSLVDVATRTIGTVPTYVSDDPPVAGGQVPHLTPWDGVRPSRGSRGRRAAPVLTAVSLAIHELQTREVPHTPPRQIAGVRSSPPTLRRQPRVCN